MRHAPTVKCYPEPHVVVSKVVPIQPGAGVMRQHVDRMLAGISGVHVFDRKPGYDPKADPEASAADQQR